MTSTESSDRSPDTLPTEPGLYYDKDGDLWHRSIAGTWTLIAPQGVHSGLNSLAQFHSPFRPARAVPAKGAPNETTLAADPTVERLKSHIEGLEGALTRRRQEVATKDAEIARLNALLTEANAPSPRALRDAYAAGRIDASRLARGLNVLSGGADDLGMFNVTLAIRSDAFARYPGAQEEAA